MGKKYYSFPAFFYYDADGISIEFPDLPGCLPCADSTEEALHNAKEALELHLYGMEQDGEMIPEPTPITELHADPNISIAMIEVSIPVRDRENSKVIKNG